MRHLRHLASLGSLLWLAACEDNPRPAPPLDAQAHMPKRAKDAGVRTDAAAVLDGGAAAAGDAALLAGDAGASAIDAGGFEGPPKPTNLSFEAAQEIVPGSPPALQSVISASQVDYFKFEGKAGEFYALSTERGNFTPDNIMSLYDADRTLLAQNENGAMWPGDKIDTRLVVRLPRTGTYYVSLHDPLLSEDYFMGALPLVFYHFTLKSLEGDVEGFTRAGDGDNALPFAIDMTSMFSYVTLIGNFTPGQSDHYTFDGLADRILVGQVLPDGLEGNGSSAHFGQLRVETSEHHTLALIDAMHGQNKFRPPVGDRQHALTVSEPADADPGDNGFYAIDVVLLPDNPREQHEDDNNQLAGAEALTMKGNQTRRGLLLSTLAEHDVDYYSFEARDNESSYALCEAESGGSGVRGLQIELRAADDTVIASASEHEDANAMIDTVALPGAGTYYLRLSADAVAKDGDDSEEPWVRCAVVVGPSS